MSITSITRLLFAGALIASAQLITPLTARAASSPRASGPIVKKDRETPFVCIVDALSPSERKRHFDELSPMLRKLKTGMRELKDGYEFQFPSDRKSFDLVSEWAIQEQLCCPFFDIAVRLDREGGPLWLRLTGRKGTKDFIRDDFAPWFAESSR